MYLNNSTAVVVYSIVMTLLTFFTSLATATPPITEEIQTTVHETLSPFLTAPSRRPQHDRIMLNDESMQIWRLESLESGEIDLKLCRAARALILGRTPKSEGVRALFERLPYLQEIELIYYRLKTSVTPDLSGRYQQRSSPVTTMKIRLSRSRALGLNYESLNQLLDGPTCTQRAQTLVDEIWISDEVTTRRDALQRVELEQRARGMRPVKRSQP